MPPPSRSRLAYIDWMRGLACVFMFQTHCYDSWLGGDARNSRFFMYSQLGGTLPAPLFLFLAGISFALVSDRLRQKGAGSDQVWRATLRRGAEILGLGLLFRLQEYAIAFPWAPWTDLLRVDILNCIGLSMMLMAMLCRLAGARDAGRSRVTTAAAAALTATAIALLTPLLWTTWRPAWLPWPLQTYLDGVHIFGKPQAWLFPVFPWAAFAFAGLATGFLLLSDWGRRREALTFLLLGAAGTAAILLARALDALPHQLYAVYDYWHTSPNFLLLRVGILWIILAGTYAWCRWGAAQWGFSPLIQMGQTSLLVYWVHIEFVYGRFSILQKHAQSIAGASLGLLTIFLAMLGLSLLRTRTKGRGAELWGRLRRPAPAAG